MNSWQVASCSEGSLHAPNMLELIAEGRHFAGSSQKIDGVALNKLLTFWIGGIWRESPLPYPRIGFAGPVHSVDVLKGDDGIHRQATMDHKDLAHGKRRFQLQKDPEIYSQTFGHWPTVSRLSSKMILAR